MASAPAHHGIAEIRTTIAFLTVVFLLLCSGATDTFAQKRFSKTYPAGKTVKFQILNRTGTITVEGWDREQVQISAYLEAPAATVEPQVSGSTIVINVVKDNQGKMGIGSVNFNVKVPYTSTVDIETMMGNLNVSNVKGNLVRAHISSEGDITLQNISASSVAAENVTGDIFFDGDIKSNGNYRFTSIKGVINLRIPFTSSFKLVATAPSTREISLGAFKAGVMNFIGDGRRVFGRFGEGAASLTVTNQRGSISFISR